MLLVLLLSLTAPLTSRDLPDPAATPGATNPAVNQNNVTTTVCVHGWTKHVRPPASYTNKLKRSQLAPGLVMRDYEEDHLISLELGGNPTDPRNLWPEHWAAPNGAHQKDRLENELKRRVCLPPIDPDYLSLRDAQAAIAGDWIAASKKYVK